MQKTTLRVPENATVDNHITGTALNSKGSAIGMNEATLQPSVSAGNINATQTHITGTALNSKGSAIGMNEAEVALNSSLAVIYSVAIQTSGDDIMVEENEAYTSLKVKEPIIQQNEAYGVHTTRDLLMESPNGVYEV